MDRILKPNLTQVNNIGLGQAFSCDLPIGPAYRYLDLVVTYTAAGGLTPAGIKDFLDLTTIYVNGKPYRAFLATEANDIWTRYGADYAATVCQTSGSGNTLIPVLNGAAFHAPVAAGQASCFFRIYFEEPWRKTWAAASSRKFYTSWAAPKGGSPSTLSSFQIQALIPATANNAGATGLSVLIYAGTDNSQGPLDKNGNPVTNALKWYRYPGVAYQAAGDVQLNNLVKYNKGQVLAIIEEMDIFSQSAGDDVNRVQVNADGRITMDATSFENWNELIRHGFNPGVMNLDEFAIVFDANDQIMDGLVLSTANGNYINNFIVTATMSAAAGGNKTLVVISQVYGPLD